jgi:dTDP-4-amino-4,6-dideoxygalactose transaminase
VPVETAVGETVPFVDLRAQYRALAPEVEQVVLGVLERCQFILGPEVAEFEADFAEFIGARHAVGVSSGLDALRVALIALGVGPGDEVVLPANTYIATALAVSSVGAKPVLVDADPHTYNIDPGLIEAALGERTRAIIPVHLTGLSADMDPIAEIASRHGLHVIEDAAQAQGTRYKGRGCGTLSAVGCFSFYPGKNLGAYGDAGALTTDDPDLAARLDQVRNYGQAEKYHHVVEGLNARLDTVQAAILTVKLRHLTAWNEARAGHARAYRERLKGIGDLRLQAEPDYSSHIHHLFMVETDSRDELQAHLAGRNVQTGIHYPIPVHLQEAYAGLGHGEGDFPVAERLAGTILSLPMFPELAPAQIEQVTAAVREFYGER